MHEYDLSYVHGSHTFFRQATKKGLPIHMELNDWAKNELSLFCESFLEEYEEVLPSPLFLSSPPVNLSF